jgi:signal transduction histidine kinase
MFGVFILACGLTHLLGIWNIWHSAYRLEGVVKAITALVSLPTAILMYRLIPKILGVPSPSALRREIEERKRAEAEVRKLNAELERRVEERAALLKRSNEAIRRFAYIASHDLQEPIRTVRSMNQLIARDYQGKLDSRADTLFGYIQEASSRMQTLVSDLLAYTRVVEGSEREQPERLDPAAVLDSVRDALAEAIERSGAVLRYSDMPEVLMNKSRLRQVFQNLLSNSIKYQRPGVHPEIEIRGEARAGECFFSVSDNGIGIDSRYSEQVFVAFKRLHGKEYPGSGVGLSICKSIVEEYGGRIWVNSEPGQGARFYFTVPLAPCPASSRHEQPKSLVS